jgi:hypothetical protein
MGLAKIAVIGGRFLNLDLAEVGVELPKFKVFFRFKLK